MLRLCLRLQTETQQFTRIHGTKGALMVSAAKKIPSAALFIVQTQWRKQLGTKTFKHDMSKKVPAKLVWVVDHPDHLDSDV